MRSPATTGIPPVPALLAEAVGAIVCGMLLAIGFGIAAGYLFASIVPGMGLLAVQVFAALLGFGVGAGGGAAVGGRLLNQRGSWWLAVLLSVLGGAMVILILRLLNVGGLGGILGVGFPVVVLLAVLGYNLRRRP